ncbi:MAG: hypothetical protein CL526_04310 [Aequorivita sp.]|nr:hypothetical protein [Aequorivita sp.]|tara:strand:+ start:34454 stop:34903 length:450 start_codon:yes stop_codon:yes gene_type:complete
METNFLRMGMIFIFFIISFYGFSQDSINTQKPIKPNVTEDFYLSDFSGSIINLIATPEKYHNKKVRVIGFLNLEFEGNAIYLHKDDYKKSIHKNGLWVTFTDESWEKIKKYRFNKSYFLIEGTYDMTLFGHMGLWSGTIKDITRIDKWN